MPNSKKKIEPTPPEGAIKGVEAGVSEVPLHPSPTDYIEMCPASVDAIFAQVLENIDDTTRKQLQHADVSAISGPNRLDLTFPLSYHFCKLQCEKPEVVTRLQQTVESIVGEKTRIVFHLSEEKRAAPVVHPTATLDQPSLADADDYVQTAADLFGGKLVKVENIGAVNDDE